MGEFVVWGASRLSRGVDVAPPTWVLSLSRPRPIPGQARQAAILVYEWACWWGGGRQESSSSRYWNPNICFRLRQVLSGLKFYYL